MNAIPGHIAIIMDGNGRWASKRNLPKIIGHNKGAEVVDTLAEYCSKIGVKALTLYSFSTENWKRPKEEVNTLMNLLSSQLKAKSNKLSENNMRFNVIGRTNELPEKLQKEIKKTIEQTKNNDGMILTLAINYGGRQEILDSIKMLFEKAKNEGFSIEDINEESFNDFLYTKDLPELDLMIRTSGEMRLSNFLLWQVAYSELYITDVLWPDFTTKELENAFIAFNNRERRFGG